MNGRKPGEPATDWDTYALTYRQVDRAREVPPLLASILRTRRPGSLLDVGCGEGDLLQRVAMDFPQSKVRGFETSAFRADLARARGFTVEVEPTGELSRGEFDVVARLT